MSRLRLGVIAFAMLALVPRSHAEPTFRTILLDGDTRIVAAQIDLSSPEDRQLMLARIEREVSKMCMKHGGLAAQHRCRAVVMGETFENLAPHIRAAMEIAVTEAEINGETIRIAAAH